MFISLFAARGFEKYHLHFRLGAFDSLFDLLRSTSRYRRDQIRSQFHVRIDQDLFRREVHRQ